jgi:hypothetical protein
MGCEVSLVENIVVCPLLFVAFLFTLGVMSLEPPSLNARLYRRDHTRLWQLFLAGLVAWFWHRPMSIPQAAISFIVGGSFIWFAWGSNLSNRFSHHKVPVVRGVWFVVAVIGVVGFMRYVIPYLHAAV